MTNNSNQIIGSITIIVIYLLFPVLPMWGIFKKTGMTNTRAFITALIPIYNFFFLFKVAGCSGWWILAFPLAPIPLLGPLIELIALINLAGGLANRFGFEISDGREALNLRSCSFMLFIYIFNPILMYVYAFGHTVYKRYD
jgi:hypothetical protein